MPNHISKIKNNSGTMTAEVVDQLSASMRSKFKSIEDVLSLHVDVDIASSDYYLIPVNIPVGTTLYVEVRDAKCDTGFNVVYVQEGIGAQIMMSINANEHSASYIMTVDTADITHFGFYTSGKLTLKFDVVYPFEAPYFVLNDAIQSGKFAMLMAKAMGGLKEIAIDFSDTLLCANTNDHNVNMIANAHYRCTGLLPTAGIELLSFKPHIDDRFALLMFYDENYKVVSLLEGGGMSIYAGMYACVPDGAKYFQYYAYVGDNENEDDFRVKLYFPSRDGELSSQQQSRTYHGAHDGYIVAPRSDKPWLQRISKTSSAEHTDYIPLRDATHLHVSKLNLSNAAYAIMFFDSNFNFIEDISILGSGAKNYSIDLTGSTYANAKYVVANSYFTSELSPGDLTVTLICDDQSSTDHTAKRVLFMGDSITALGDDARGWPGYFKIYAQCSASVNVAVSGATWCDRRKDTVYDGEPHSDDDLNVLGNQVEKISRGKDESNPHYSRVEEYQEFDAIFIAAGTNDKIPSGEIADQFFNGTSPISIENVDRTTWAGAVRYAYEKLRQMYPTAKIFICSPIQGAEDVRSYAQITTKRNYLRDICDRISDVIFTDTFACGICGVYESRNTIGRDLNDGLHPNANGAKKMAKYNVNEMAKAYVG